MSVSVLKKVSWLKGLPEPVLRRVLAASEARDCRAGEVLFAKAQSADCAFIVASGRVKIHSQSNSRKRKTFAYLGPGGFFGEMALLEGKTRMASATAAEPTRVLLIDKKAFKRLLLSDARLCYNLLRSVSARLRHADEEIESLLFRNILGRVSKAIAESAPAGGWTITQQELADLVGTTREPLARALGKLRATGFIATGGGRITVREPGRLAALVEACSG